MYVWANGSPRPTLVTGAIDGRVVRRVQMANVSDHCQTHHLVVEVLGRGGSPDAAAVLFARVGGDISCLCPRAAGEQAQDRRPKGRQILPLFDLTSSGSDLPCPFTVPGVRSTEATCFGNRRWLSEGAAALPAF